MPRHTPVRTLALLLMALALAAPIGLASTLTPSVTEPSLASSALASEAQAQALAAQFPQGAPFAAQLATLTGASGPTLAPVSFEDALAALDAAAGVPAALRPVPAAPLPDAVKASVAPAILAAAHAGVLARDAMAGLTPAERTQLGRDLPAFLASDDADLAARENALFAKIDMAKMGLAAATLAAGLDAVKPVTDGVAATWVDPSGLVEIGSTGPDCYTTTRVLIIDLGGDDCYQGEPATVGPGSNLLLPISAIVDLGGDDSYTVDSLDSTSTTSAWGNAVGIGGVGLILDRWGDDVYQGTLDDKGWDCPQDWRQGNMQALYANGVGIGGVGSILDLSGDDQYLASNTNDVSARDVYGNPCHFGWVYTYADAAGVMGGVGAILDDTGDDHYTTYSAGSGEADNIVTNFDEGVGMMGVGALVDKEGQDAYWSHANATITPYYVKGAFAYDFAQGSASVTQHAQPQPGGSPLIASPIATTALDLCRVSGPAAGAPDSQGGCSYPSVGLLIDILGQDTFTIDPSMADNGAGCGNGGWALASGQGSSAWEGLGALVALDVEGQDRYLLAPRAVAGSCGAPGIHAMSYGQGYGGAILWDFWDHPTAPSSPAVGIMLNVGLPQRVCDAPGQPLDPTRIKLVLSHPLGPACFADGTLPPLANAATQYVSIPVAKDTAPYCYPAYGLACTSAESWVQGASNDLVVNPAKYWAPDTYAGDGIGIHVDTGGDDRYLSAPRADGTVADAFTGAQASTVGGLAVLANLGGDDVYLANAWKNGVDDILASHVQGYADGSTSISVPPDCVSISNPPIGVCTPGLVFAGQRATAIFVDVAGLDQYSEAPERAGCQTNGNTLGGWPLGTQALGTVWWGTEGAPLAYPCSGPSPDVGSGLVIGLDWASDLHL